MKREKHGQYDHEKGQPDNRMQPTGSGQGVWLNEQVLILLGEQEGQALIEQSVTHKVKRYDWLCAQMAERGYPELTAQYCEKIKDAAAVSRLRDKKRELDNWRERLKETPETDQATRNRIQQKIAKAEKYISERSPNSLA